MEKGKNLSSRLKYTKNKKPKFAQTTIFIILAIVIVLAIAIATYFSYLSTRESSDREFFASTQIKPSLNNLEISMIDCSEDISKDSLNLIALQGGYYKKPSTSLDLGGIFIPYYYDENTIKYPSKQEVELELASYTNDKITNCLKNINQQGFKLSFKESNTNVEIKEKQVNFQINLPVTITKDNHNIEYKFSDHLVTINSELNAILEIAELYTNSHSINPELYCVTCISELAEENDLYFTLVPINELTNLVIISESHTSPDQYSFEFLNRYTGDEQSPPLIIEDTEIVPPPPSG